MKKEFWQEKWQANEIGFHQDSYHPLLEKYSAEIAGSDAKKVFVPLCGKSRDMVYLANQGLHVVGLELSEIAAADFFKENQLQVSIEQGEAYTFFKSEKIDIICGDFFQVTADVTGELATVFDRAALIAMPPEMRENYVRKMRELCSSGTQILLIALEYEPDLVNPPPFAVTKDKIEALYQSWCEIEQLEIFASDVKGKPAKEVVYKMSVL